jgi:hypothetical protein
MDSFTLIDPQFDPRPSTENPYLQIALREETYALALAYADSANYTYKAWAIKSLLEVGVNFLQSKEVLEIIRREPELRELYTASSGKIRRITVHVYPSIRASLKKLMTVDQVDVGKHPYNAVILSALIHHAIRRRKGLNEIENPLLMFDGAIRYLDELQRGKRFIY